MIQVNDPNTPVCFGAKDDSYGKFVIPSACTITHFRLVYVSGPGVTWYTPYSPPKYWGSSDYLLVYITDSSRNRICPSPSTSIGEHQEYSLPGITNMDPQLTFPELFPHLSVQAGKEFRVWFGQDLFNSTESNNSGETCLNVWILKY